MNNPSTINISTWTILKIIAILLGLALLWLARDVLVLLLVVLILVAGLNPLVNYLDKFLPRVISVLLVFLVIIAFWTAAAILLTPAIITQVDLLIINLPHLINNILPDGFLDKEYLSQITSSSPDLWKSIYGGLEKIGLNIYATTIGFLSVVTTIITIGVLSFYLLLEKAAGRHLIAIFVPEKWQKITLETLSKISRKIGSWMLGQVCLCLAVGILNLIGMLIFGLPYPLALAVWAGLTEVIPYIGPWIGGIPIVLIAFSSGSIWTAIFMLIWVIAIQQLESTFLVPKIMGRALGLSPVVVILAILIGFKLLGLLGVILALPIAAGLIIVIQEYRQIKKNLP